MDYLVRLVQAHETFRKPELESLAEYEKISLEILDYQPSSPFCKVRFHPHQQPSHPQDSTQSSSVHSDTTAQSFISRSILSRGIYELWGQGSTYSLLHEDIKTRISPTHRDKYKHSSFRFSLDCFYGKRSFVEQKAIISSFRHLGFQGKATMKNPDVEFVVFEEWDEYFYLQGPRPDDPNLTSRDANNSPSSLSSSLSSSRQPVRIFLARLVGESRRRLVDKHDLKKRPYISTTSMDAELALVTATLALAGPGKLFLDPFVGTGGFMVAAAELGAITLGSDIDGRSYRGKGKGMEKGIMANFRKYELVSQFGDSFTSDLTNTPLRLWSLTDPRSGSRGDGKRRGNVQTRWLDGIISDPPYGVREGLKVLGVRPSRNGTAATASQSFTSIDAQRPTPSSSLSTLSPGQTSLSSQHDESQLEASLDQSSTLSVSLPSSLPINPVKRQPAYVNGRPAHLEPDYIAPKRPYSFTSMLRDILDFAARTLVDNGCLAFWMPTANDVDSEFILPTHPALHLKHICVQNFNKWSRKLLIYERVIGDEWIGQIKANGIDIDAEGDRAPKEGVVLEVDGIEGVGIRKDTIRSTADDLNPFRKMYFRSFQAEEDV